MGEDMNLPWSLVTWDGRAQEKTEKPGKQYVLVTIIRGSEGVPCVEILIDSDIELCRHSETLADNCSFWMWSSWQFPFQVKLNNQIPPRPEDQSLFENNIVFIKGLLIAGLSPTSLIATGALLLWYYMITLSFLTMKNSCIVFRQNALTSNCFV